jgi:hypothetical protein
MRKLFLVLSTVYAFFVFGSCTNQTNNSTQSNNDNQLTMQELSVPAIFYRGFDYYSPTYAIITMNSNDIGSIFYTTDGSIPTSDMARYSLHINQFFISSSTAVTGVQVPKGCTVKAICSKEGYLDSKAAALAIPESFVLTPPFFGNFGTLTSDSTTAVIAIQCNDLDAAIYFTTNGNDPTTQSPKYSQQCYQYIVSPNGVCTGVLVTRGSTVKAFASSAHYSQTTSIVSFLVQ